MTSSDSKAASLANLLASKYAKLVTLDISNGSIGPAGGPVEIPLATENLLENTAGVPPHPLVFSRGGTLLPCIYADARYIDAVVASKACAGQQSQTQPALARS